MSGKPCSPYGSELLRLLRPHQWAKNLLLFLPVLLAHQLDDSHRLLRVVWGATMFSLAASAVYTVNDARDLEADRLHPRKRNRPLARGTIPSAHVPFIASALAAAALAGSALWISREFVLWLLVYLVANGLYTFRLKQIPILDVLLLTLMYVLRLQAGGVAGSVEVTGWLLSFSLFVFLSLALGKRYQELAQSRASGADDDSPVRGYQVGDLNMVCMLGVVSGLVSVLVLALYLRGDRVMELYRAPALLWPLCPLVLYWLGRFWFLNTRGRMGDDPVLFALRDPVSYLVGLLLLAIVLAARHLQFAG